MKIRRLHGSELDIGLSCLASFWRKDHIMVLSPEFFRWQFSPPEQAAEDLSFWVAEQDSLVAGCCGEIPVNCHYAGEIFPGTGLSKLFARLEYRKYKVGLRLVHSIFKGRGLYWGLGNTFMSQPVWALLGLHTPEAMPRYACLVSRERLAEILRYSRESLATIDDYADTPRLSPATVLEPGYKVETLALEDLEEWDRAWRTSLAPLMSGVYKNAAYLKWRYLDHPLFSYQLLAVRDKKGNLTGLAVTRTAQICPEACAVRVLEFFAEEERAGRALAAGLAERLPASTAYLEHTVCGKWWEPLRAIGMAPMTSPGFSYYFSPPNLAYVQMQPAFGVDLPGWTAESFMTDPRIYLSVADGDLDEPR